MVAASYFEDIKIHVRYCICDPFEGNVHVIIQKRELLVSFFRKFAFAVLKAWKFQ